MKLAACVVLYNPDDKILNNVKTYQDEVGDLIILDNSQRPSKQFFDFSVKRSGTHYIHFSENKGIAYALNYACELASSKGYEWLLTMDQDSRIINNEFFDLVRQRKSPEVCIYAASYTSKFDRWVKSYDDEFQDIHFTITSGNILNLSKWKNLDGFEEKLFIDEVDHDFCIKSRLKNWKILTSRRIFLGHSVGVSVKAADSGVGKTTSMPEPFRTYYITRNTLYVIRKYFMRDGPFAFNRIVVLVKSLGRILFLYPRKRQFLYFFVKGIVDFIQAKYGRLGQ